MADDLPRTATIALALLDRACTLNTLLTDDPDGSAKLKAAMPALISLAEYLLNWNDGDTARGMLS